MRASFSTSLLEGRYFSSVPSKRFNIFLRYYAFENCFNSGNKPRCNTAWKIAEKKTLNRAFAIVNEILISFEDGAAFRFKHPRFIIRKKKTTSFEFDIGLEVRRYRAIRLLYFCGRTTTVLILTIVRERSLSATNTIFRYSSPFYFVIGLIGD